MHGLAFVRETRLRTTPQRLWTALTTQRLIRYYWRDRCIESTWEIESPVRLVDGDSDATLANGFVIQASPPRRLTFSLAPSEEPTLTRGRVAFEMRPAEDEVRLSLVYDRLAEPTQVEQARREWTPMLDGLRAFLHALPPAGVPEPAKMRG